MTSPAFKDIIPYADDALNQEMEKAINKLPPTLAFPINNVFKEIDSSQYYRACNHMLDFFELCSQYLSFVLMRILQNNGGKKSIDTLIKFINFVDAKRALSMGDWAIIFESLLKTAHEEQIDNYLILSLYKNLSPKGKNILTDNKDRRNIVNIRNQEFGHSTTPSEAKCLGLIKEMGDRFVILIKAILPIADCKIDILESSYIIDFSPIGSPLVINLFPFLYLEISKNAIYIFQTLKEEKTEYVSANELADKESSTKMNNFIDEDFQKIVPSFDIAQSFNWKELQNKMATASVAYLQQMKNEGKYNPRAFVERKSLSSMFNSFWESEKIYFPLIGDAGQGKTNQLCFWTDKLCNQGEAVLMFSCSDLTMLSLEEKFRSVFGYNNKKILSIIKDLNKAAQTENKYIYIFLDALNEALIYDKDNNNNQEGPLSLFNNIVEVFGHSKDSRFKVVITCRSFTWSNVILPNIDSDTNSYLYNNTGSIENIKGFNSDEIEIAYQKYRDIYNIKTKYSDIDHRVSIRLSDPLILKFASEVYSGKELGDQPSDFTTLSIFDNIISNFTGAGANDRIAIIRGLGGCILDLYLADTPSDGISTDDLIDSLNNEKSELYPLASLMYSRMGDNISEQKPFTDLLMQNFIKETQRGNSLYGNKQIQFVYERFLEYVMGIELWHHETQKHTNQDMLIPASCYVNILNGVSEQVKRSVVFTGTIRNTLIIDALAHHNDFSTILKLEADYGNDYHVMTLVREAINTMTHENYEYQLFNLLRMMMEPSEKAEIIKQYNDISATILEGQIIDDDIYHKKTNLYNELSSIIRLRKLASVSLFNGILLTDYYNRDLYNHSVTELVRLIMNDAIYEIRNDACMYAYYLSKKTHTTGGNLICENLTMRIVNDLFQMLISKNVATTLVSSTQRQEFLNLIEIACRLGVLMIIDNMDNDRSFSETAITIRNQIRQLLKHFTGNFLLIKVVMPFFQLLMRKQLKFQSDYVNNVEEYATFWDKKLMDNIEDFHGERWERADIISFVSFIQHYASFGEDNSSKDCIKREEEFNLLHNKILSAYKSGHSFLYFVLERVLVVMGVSRWNNVRDIYTQFFSESFLNNLSEKGRECYRYSQMSLLYSMYQVSIHRSTLPSELLDIYGKVASEWTLSTKGLFKGQRSDKANPIGKYKRNVMCWYAVVYGAYSGGDGKTIAGDNTPVPCFYQLIDKAIVDNDKELLFHLIDNISELITDMGYILTAKQLIKYILTQYNSEEKVRIIDNVKIDRNGIYQYDLIQLIGSVFSTAKNYFPQEIDIFIQQEISGLKFPGVTTYRENIVNYLPCGEQLSDLLTHKFGNFLMRLLLEEEEVGDFAKTVIAYSLETKSSIAWYEKVVKYGAFRIFNLKL